MSLETIRFSDGKVGIYDTSKLSERISFEIQHRINKRHLFSNDRGKEFLRSLLPPTVENFLFELEKLPSIESRVLLELLKAGVEDPEGLRRAFYHIDFRISSIWSIPSCLENLANIKDDGIGCGEALLLFMVADAQSHGSGTRYDIIVPWNDGKTNAHIKDLRIDSASPMGKPKGTQEFFKTPLMQHLLEYDSDLHQRLQAQSFSADIGLVEHVMRYYETDDVSTAAHAFVQELNEDLRNSEYIGDAIGIIGLKRDSAGKSYIRLIEKDAIYFNELGGRGLKVCDDDAKFLDAFMHHTVKRMKEQGEIERQARLKERKELISSLRQEKEKLKEDLQRTREENRLKLIELTYELYMSKPKKTFAATSRDLWEQFRIKVGATTVKRYIKEYEDRINRRSDETGDPRSLVADQACVQGE